jgi:hypothetical protein
VRKNAPAVPIRLTAIAKTAKYALRDKRALVLDEIVLIGGGFAVRSRWGARECRSDERNQDEPDSGDAAYPDHRPSRIARA